MEKITKREMFEAISEAMETGECKFAPEVIKEFCTKEIEALDKKALKAKERAAAKKAENDELYDAVYKVMSAEEFETIADIAAKVEHPDATVGKVQYRLRKLVENGLAEKQEITIPANEGGKASKRQGYRRLDVEAAE